MESMGVTLPSTDFWRHRRVFLTGHTGFKGGWLALWLTRLGAEVHGFSLAPPTVPNFFTNTNVASILASDTRGDIRDHTGLMTAITNANPEVVFHMAAQPLVRASYRDPLKTFSTNVMGTANLLDACRHAPALRSVLIVTTDKCYENSGDNGLPFRETDPLGGHDPYSGSKACAELVAASYRASFFASQGTAAIATARAGNVIGGGDWAEDRLIPDCIRAVGNGRSIDLRYPRSIRPWQHVVEPLSGYLLLAEALSGGKAQEYAQAWNFGPDKCAEATVGDIAQQIMALWDDGAINTNIPSCNHYHEASRLLLDSTKAQTLLGWAPRWPLQRALRETVSWYKAWHDKQDMQAYTLSQIAAFEDGT